MGCLPNRAIGSRSSMMIMEELVFAQPAGSTGAVGIDFKSETLANDVEQTPAEPLVTMGRAKRPDFVGLNRPGGDITGELQLRGGWPILLKHVLGGSVVNSGSGPYVHVMKGSNTLPVGLTVEKQMFYRTGSRRLRFLGGKVSKLLMRATAQGMAEMTASLSFGRMDEPNSDLDAAPDYPANARPLTGLQVVLFADLDANGTREAIGSIATAELTISQVLDDDQYGPLTGPDRREILEGTRTVQLSGQVMFTPDTYQLYTALRADTQLSAEIRATQGTDVLSILLPNVRSRGNPQPKVADRGPIPIPLLFNAFYDNTLATEIQVTLTNGESVLAALP